MFSIRKTMAVGVLIACFTGWALAQGGATGAITGTVQDATGAVVSGAKVDIVSEATGQVDAPSDDELLRNIYGHAFTGRRTTRRSQRQPDSRPLSIQVSL